MVKDFVFRIVRVVKTVIVITIKIVLSNPNAFYKYLYAADAISRLTGTPFGEYRATRRPVICSNFVKIKSSSYKILFIPKL